MSRPAHPLRVAQALPPGSDPARGQAAWLAAVDAHDDVAELRIDAWRNLRAIAWLLAARASWTDRTTMPTWQLLEEQTGLSRRTVARWLAWLRVRGLLGVLETGSTPLLRPMALAGDEANHAAVYVLAVPRRLSVDGTGTPTVSDGVGDPDAGARASADTAPLRGAERPAEPEWPLFAPARTRDDRLELARRLQNEVTVLHQLSTRHVRHLLRPWLVAGWAVRDVLWALDHRPDGTAYTFTADVRRPAGWLAHRMAPWAGLAPPRAAAEVAAAAERDAAAVQRASWAAAAAAAADVDHLRHAAAARAALRQVRDGAPRRTTRRAAS